MRKRNMSILIHVSNDELELINRKAQRVNSNRNDYIIDMVISPPKSNGEALKHILQELKVLNRMLNSMPYETATESEKRALVGTEELMNKIYQEIYLISRKE